MRFLTMLLIFTSSMLSSMLRAQASNPEPDVLVFTNGDKLAGQFIRSTGASVTFKSDMLGEIHVDWTKLKELHTAKKVAVIQKGVRVDKANESTIPQGTIA